MPDKNTLDKENLRQVILDFPAQFEKGLKLAEEIKISGIFSAATVSGMGGSALPADLLKNFLEEKGEFPGIFSNRNYSLPEKIAQGALNVFVSYSGGTEETLSSLKEAIQKKYSAVSVSTGGKLKEISENNQIPTVIFPTTVEPRYATGYIFSILLKILSNHGMIKNHDAEIIVAAKNLSLKMPALEEKGRVIARNLSGKTPVIYASERLKSVAMVWKIKINENAKTPAFWNVFPEMNHNEMVGFTLPRSPFHAVFLSDRNDHPQIKKRMLLTAKLLEEKGISSELVEMEEENVFETIFSAVLLGDWASYYLALEYNQDPSPVKMVEDLKKLLL